MFNSQPSKRQTFGEIRRSTERSLERERVDAGLAMASEQTRALDEFEERVRDWVRQTPSGGPPAADSLCATPPFPQPPGRSALWRRLLGIDGAYRRALKEHVELCDQLSERAKVKIDAVSAARDGYLAGDIVGVRSWLSACLEAEPTIDGCPSEVRAEYQPTSQMLIVEYDIPPFDVVPEESGFRYVRQSNAIVATKKSAGTRRDLYTEVVSAITLRALGVLFAGDDANRVSTIVFNAYVDSIEPHSGRPVRPCVLTVRVTREQFEALRIEMVEPVACLRSLSAVVSRHPEELIPITPICNLELSDRRFVPSDDVLANLESRTNLLELTPGEFESLITNLFSSMGLETRLTQPSRDGGVDCVAFDLRPVLGGKVVIQAKRYSGTVGVSAVRDLYGTMLNEGAGKGVLVTTSGYGPAAYEFAANKPLELLSGGNLLALLAEWAGIEARIEPVEDRASL